MKVYFSIFFLLISIDNYAQQRYFELEPYTTIHHFHHNQGNRDSVGYSGFNGAHGIRIGIPITQSFTLRTGFALNRNGIISLDPFKAISFRFNLDYHFYPFKRNENIALHFESGIELHEIEGAKIPLFIGINNKFAKNAEWTFRTRIPTLIDVKKFNPYYKIVEIGFETGVIFYLRKNTKPVFKQHNPFTLH